MTATSGAAMCNHSVRVARSPPIMVGPIPRTASKSTKTFRPMPKPQSKLGVGLQTASLILALDGN